MGRPGELKLNPDRPSPVRQKGGRTSPTGYPAHGASVPHAGQCRHFLGQTFTALALSTAIDAVFEAITFFTFALSR